MSMTRWLEGRSRRLSIESLETRRVLAGDPLISEFQASNSTTLQDGDGDSSDWIEIRNSTGETISLGGWYLTDDLADLTKWQFPADETIAAGEHRLVFASGKDKVTADGELHTGFSLSSNGEQLALVRPDGTTISQSFDPYPEQLGDQSYGLALGREASLLRDDAARIEAFVPQDDSLGLTWTDVGFDASGWQQGTGSAGFEVLEPGFQVLQDFSQDALSDEWTIDSPVAPVTEADGTLYLRVSTGLNLTSEERGEAPIVSRELPGNSPADWEMIARLRQGAADRGAAGIAVLDAETGLPVLQLEYNSRLNFRLTSNGSSVGSSTSLNQNAYQLRIVRESTTRTWSGYFRLAETDEWTLIGSIADSEGGPNPDQPRLAMYARTPSSIMNARFQSFEINVFDELPVYGPHFDLDLDAQMRGKNSSTYLRMPFVIEGEPARFSELDLAAQFDDGFRAYLNGVEVAAENVPIEATFNSTASTEFGAVNGVIPTRQIDLSEHVGVLTSGENVLSIHAMNAGIDDDDFFFSAKLVATEILDQTEQFFLTPTPSAPNWMPAAPPPVIETTEGIFFGSTTLELTLPVANPNFEVRYTMDGTEPSETSTLYEGPIELARSAMLQARTFDTSIRSSFEPSPVASGTFVAMVEELREFNSDVPLLVLDTLDQRIPGSGSVSLAAVDVVAFDVSKATGRSSLENGKLDYLGRGGIRDRGSSTGGQAKPNLAFETWGSAGTNQDDDEDVGLFGFSPDSDWVLHAPFTFDRAFIRNQLAFGMANAIGRWAPGTRIVEVFLNRDDEVVEERDYFGLYVLMEKIKQGPHRVDIAPITPEANTEPDISGGYIWKIDRADPGEPGFAVSGATLNWVEPKSPESSNTPADRRATQAQQDWVVDYFAAFRATTTSADISDPEGYSKYIDVLSWVDHHLISVLGDNVDALNLSTYLFKDRGGKIEFGPQWDFDRSMESADDRDDDPRQWGGSGGTAFFTSNLWNNMFRDPGFWQAYVDRWTELRRDALSDESLNAMVDFYAAEVAESSVRNIERWRASRGRTTSPYPSDKLDGTWEGEVEHLRTWLLDRADFMDSNFAQPPSLFLGEDETTQLPMGGVSVPPNQPIRLEGPVLEFFDDSEFISSEVGAVTASYFVPTDDSLGTDWTLPDFDASAWASGPLGLGFDEGDDYTALIGTEVMPAQDGTTILSRIDFTVDDPTQAENLILRMRYDDGFVAYLNGTEIRQQNLRDTDLTWSSRARSHRDADGVRFEDFDVSEYANQLVQGRNVLAVRIINSSSTSNDVFAQVALVNRDIMFGISPNAAVYYTTDGSDPRGPDGLPNPGAIRAVAGQEISFSSNTRITARNFDDISDRGPQSRTVGTNWSAPAVYDVVVESPELLISEVNYHPSSPSSDEAANGWTDESFEFIEIANVGSTDASLVGVRLSGGVDFDFSNSQISSIQPGQHAVVVADVVAFESRYGTEVPVAGTFSGRLDNGGERIQLSDGLGTPLTTLSYEDNDLWGISADGHGATLELVRSDAFGDAVGKWYNWQSSSVFNGTPGQPASERSPIVINEVLARTTDVAGAMDFIELHNTGTESVDISGWYLSDSDQNFFKFQIPAGTTLAPGGYQVFDATAFDPPDGQAGTIGFGLSGSQGDSVWLTEGDGSKINAFVDDVHFGPSAVGEAWGRTTAASGRLAPMAEMTPSAVNSAPRVGPIIISEIQYEPELSDVAVAADPGLEASDLEFIELHNPTATPLSLTGWRLRGGVDMEFSEREADLLPGGTLVVLKFDPDDPENVNQVAAFRAHYGIDQSVRLTGGYRGLLNNRGDRIELQRPELANGNTIHLQEDEVVYDTLPAWPTLTEGASLNRSSHTAFGNDGANWFAASGTPGSISENPLGDVNGDGRTNDLDIDSLTTQILAGQGDTAFDLNQDGMVDDADRRFLLFDVMGTTFGDADLSGAFDSRDLVRLFQAGGYEDNIAGNAGWATGDWNGDGDFTSNDLLLAEQEGGYVRTIPPMFAVVPIGVVLPEASERTSLDLESLAAAALERDLVDSHLIEQLAKLHAAAQR